MVLHNERYRKPLTIHSPKMHAAFYVLLAALMVLGVITSLFAVLAFVLFAAYVLLAESKKVFLSLFFLMPFAHIFKLSSGSTSLFTFIEIIVLVKLVLQAKKINVKFLASWLILVVYLVVGFNMNVSVLIKQAMILPLIYFFFDENNKPDIKPLTLSYANGLLLSSLVGLFRDVIPNMDKFVIYDKAFDIEGEVYRFGALYSDPNYYSMSLILVLVGILVLYARNRMGGVAFLYYAVVAFFGAITVSKSFVLMFAIVTIANIYLLIRNKKMVGALLFSASVIVFAVLIFSGKIEMFNSTLDRFSSSQNLLELTTGRSRILQKYWTYLTEDVRRILLGAGVGANMLGAAVAHNTYFDFLYYYGMLGTVLFAVSLSFAVKTNNRGKIGFFNVFPMICAIIMLFFLSGLLYYDFVFTLMYVFLYLGHNFDASSYGRKKLFLRNNYENQA